ncbi:MAG: hypothetical protein LBC87_11300 [Fibromonadaceae bacterium]|nr:hypothetical protein [Fibromonadaceae bacterium]
MKATTFSTVLMVSFFAICFLQSCEDKAEKERKEIVNAIIPSPAAAALKTPEEQAKEKQAEELKKKLAAQAAEAEKKRQEKIAKENAIAMIRQKLRDLEKNPSNYISFSQCNFQASGIVNSYIGIKSCAFTNNSDFPLEDISGNFVVATSNGMVIVPFRTPVGHINPRSIVVLPTLGIEKVKLPGKMTGWKLEILRVSAVWEGTGDHL